MKKEMMILEILNMDWFNHNITSNKFSKKESVFTSQIFMNVKSDKWLEFYFSLSGSGAICWLEVAQCPHL